MRLNALIRLMTNFKRDTGYIYVVDIQYICSVSLVFLSVSELKGKMCDRNRL